MIQLKYIIFFILFFILSYFYNKIKKEESKNTNEHYFKMIDKYLLTPESLGKNNKPCLWIHINNENSIISNVNSRKWLDFYSRNTKNLNQPYQLITIKTIIDYNKNDFNICMIDNSSFKKIIPNWTFDIDKMSNPIKNHIRNIALSRILNIYGGLLIPSSFICYKNLKPLWNNIESNKIFTVSEMINKSFNESFIQETLPSNILMGSTANNDMLNEFIKFQEITISQNQSSEFEFNGILGKWLLENNNSIGLIESKLIGIKDENNKVITLDKLMSNEMIDFNCNKYGIYIPWDELLTRVNYQWFSYLTVEEVLNSNNNLGKLLLLANQI
jgi:hypothetical protein